MSAAVTRPATPSLSPPRAADPLPGTDARTRPRILTTYDKNGHAAWIGRVHLLAGWHEEVMRTWNKPISPLYRLKRDVVWAWRIFRRSRRYDVVITGSDRASTLFAVLQGFFRRRRVPHIFIDCLWYTGPRGRPRELRRRLLRRAAAASSFLLVQTRRQVRLYAEHLGVDPARFVFVPYHATIYDLSPAVRDGDYVFAGGDSNRDYGPLLQVARSLPCRVVIAAVLRDHFEGRALPGNVEVVTATHAEFIELAAGSRAMVVPLRPSFIHAGGQQTYLNAMSLGKPVVVADDSGAEDYIEHGVNGFIVPPADPQALQEVLLRVIEDRDLARRVGAAAAETARRYSPERFFERVFALADEALRP